jgi:hypothetical protein
MVLLFAHKKADPLIGLSKIFDLSNCYKPEFAWRNCVKSWLKILETSTGIFCETKIRHPTAELNLISKETGLMVKPM